MSLTLILMRHAKSDWDAESASDHDRPLNERGVKSAAKIGSWLTENNYAPQKALVSDARRTRETWSLVSNELPSTPLAEFSSRLYHASPATIVAEIESQGGSSPLIVIGHNPGFALLAEHLAQTAPKHPRFFDYPTAATTILDFDIKDWSEIGLARGVVKDFVIPREL